MSFYHLLSKMSNTIDRYSDLNTSLNLKSGKLKDITSKVSEDIWKVFLESNKRKTDGEKAKKNKLDRFSNSIEWASEWAKANFILSVNYLSKNNLIKTDKIKALKLRVLENDTNPNDKIEDARLENILTELTQGLSESEKLSLQQYVSKELLNLSEQADSADNLWRKINDLEQQNSDLKGELDALDTVSEVSERAVLKRRSKYKMIRIWNSIKNINDSNLDKETKARKILWQANSFAVFWTWKRFDWFVNKFPKKFDVNEEYKKSVDKLKEKMNASTDDGEKVAIRYIMRQVNKAYKDYLDVTNISEDTRKQNMRDINMAMAA